MAKDKVKNVKEREGFIQVTTTVLGEQKTKGKKIKVRPFVTEPALVDVMFGTWLPTGDYTGIKAEVRIVCPCYREEIVDVFHQVSTQVDELLDAEVERLTEGIHGGGD